MNCLNKIERDTQQTSTFSVKSLDPYLHQFPGVFVLVVVDLLVLGEAEERGQLGVQGLQQVTPLFLSLQAVLLAARTG